MCYGFYVTLSADMFRSADLQRSLSAAEPALKAALTAILRHLDRSDKILERTASDGRQSGGE